MISSILRIAKSIVTRFPKFTLMLSFSKQIWQIHETPVVTPLGFKFTGNKLMEDGIFEPEETKLVRQALPNVNIVINVGANIGYYCCIALSECKFVVAFEPFDLNLRKLLWNLRVNDWESEYEIYPMALSDRKTGVVEMYGSGTGASLVKGWADAPDFFSTFVPTSTLDQILGHRFQGERCLIIVDIEGSEHLMLRGADSFLAKDPKPIWLVEISVSEHQPKGVRINPNLLSTFDFFWKHGYDAWTVNKNSRIINRDELQEISRTGDDTLLTHSFLFVDKGMKSELIHFEQARSSGKN